jgi:hypothetical protein
LTLNGGNVSQENTPLTPEILEGMGYNGIPDTTKENTTLPINLTHSDKDTLYNADSTQVSFNRNFFAWIYSGGVTKSDSALQKITVEDLIGPQTKVHLSYNTGFGGLEDTLLVDGAKLLPDSIPSPQYLKDLGYAGTIPDTTKEHTNLPINLTYKDENVVWDGNLKVLSFDRKFTGSIYSFGKTLSDSLVQKVIIQNFTPVEDFQNTLPNDFKLYQNYPNPFNPTTTIKYKVPNTANVELKVYNALGQEVKTLVDEVLPSGEYTTKFDGKDLSSGVYFLRMVAKSESDKKVYSESEKMVLMK